LLSICSYIIPLIASDFYLGTNWREDYSIRPEVQQYLDHLR
jgi:hypothetical protein